MIKTNTFVGYCVCKKDKLLSFIPTLRSWSVRLKSKCKATFIFNRTAWAFTNLTNHIKYLNKLISHVLCKDVIKIANSFKKRKQSHLSFKCLIRCRYIQNMVMTDCDWKLDYRRAQVSLSGMQGWFSKMHCLTSAKLPPKWCRPHTVKTPCSSAQRPARTRTNNLMEEDNALSFSASLHSHLYRISLCASPSPLLPFMIWSEPSWAGLNKKGKEMPWWAETPKRRKQTGGKQWYSWPKTS